ncbi:hypothetical protein [Helicobacter pullorum]|uniref:hypothetical protein n=1 Tax=Helicobacter pullorum TaxID=35818 RepID=UPI000816A819|nr:hypothetical protein [Helicobacter pullorum]OCR14085.1 hypothetical protein BA916_07085 [Helicobacter pullorum]
MFLIISNIFKLANLFKNVLFKRIVNPIQSAYLVSLVWEIKNVFDKEKQTSEAICQTLDLLSKFKKQHPEDFDEIFEIFKEILESYEQSPNEVKRNLKELL